MANPKSNNNNKSKSASANSKKKTNSNGNKTRKRKQETDFERRRRNKNITFERDEDDLELEEGKNHEAFGKFAGKNKTIHDEVTLIITGLISILLILSYCNACGKLGKVINSICFGFTGVFAYVLPFYIFALVAFILYNTNKYVTNDKIMLSVFGVFIICALIHTATLVDDIGLFFESFRYGTYKRGGGFLGALLSEPLNTMVGKVATIIILIAMLLIVIILITGKAVLHALTDKSKKEYSQLSEKYKENKEKRAKENLERKAQLGEEQYKFITEDGNKLYDIRMGDEKKPQATVTSYERVPRTTKKKETFVDKLKNGKAGGSVVKTPDKDVATNLMKQEEEVLPKTDNDMFEITADENELPTKPENESIWEEELKKKFGNTTSNDSNFTPLEDVHSLASDAANTAATTAGAATVAAGSAVTAGIAAAGAATTDRPSAAGRAVTDPLNNSKYRQYDDEDQCCINNKFAQGS